METAVKQTYIVALETVPGFKKKAHKVIVVEAHSPDAAKLEAFKKMQRGPFKHTHFSCWRFNSVTLADKTSEVISE